MTELRSAYSLFTEEYRRNPFPVLNRLREAAPVHRHEEGFWTVTRYADVERCVKNPAVFSNAIGRAGTESKLNPRAASYDSYGHGIAVRRLSQRDDPSHSSLRRVMAKAFTPRSMGPLEPQIRGIVAKLIAELRTKAADGAALDWVNDFAYPLTTLSIDLVLGAPESMGFRYLQYTTETDADLGEHFLELAQYKEQHLTDDITSDLLRAARDGHEHLPPEEVYYYLGALWTAGNWTTTLLIANAAVLLQRHPEVRAALRADPGLVPAFVEEALRCEPPVLATDKTALSDVEVGGQRIRAGEQVLFCYAAANRDPRVFNDPERFDLHRSPNRHLSFSDGVHVCLGAPLARMEAVLGFGMLLEQDVRFELDLSAGPSADGNLWGYRALPMTLHA